MANTPDLKGKASEIDDTKLLFDALGIGSSSCIAMAPFSPERIYKGHVAAPLIPEPASAWTGLPPSGRVGLRRSGMDLWVRFSV
jgi:hypothetical protein